MEELDPTQLAEERLADDGGATPDGCATGDDGAPAGDAVDDAAAAAAAEVQASEDATLRAILEAIVYVTDEPLSAHQIAAALGQPIDKVKRQLDALVEEFAKSEHGLSIRELAGGYQMATKAEHHEAVRAFVKKLTPPLKLSLPALETLAVIAYKQPVTTPEIMDIRGVQGAGVLKTLLDRRLITESGRKNVIGKPILYKTTKEFLVQFGLKDLSELPTPKEFEELGRLEIAEPVTDQLPLIDLEAEQVVPEETPVDEAEAEVESASPEPAAMEPAASEPAPSEPAGTEAAPDESEKDGSPKV